MAYLELKNVYKSYGQGSESQNILKDINLEIEEGEFVAIVGFSGSGKTTLINLISGLQEQTSGEILFKGTSVSGTSHERGVIFQNYSLLPWLSVYQNVLIAVKETFPNKSKKELDHIVRSYLDMVNLSPAIDKRQKSFQEV